jgi:hypothetical protein
MIQKFTLALILLCAFTVSFQSCKEDDEPVKKDDPTPTDTTSTVDTVRYTSFVKMVLDTSCATPFCHNAGSGLGSLASYDDAKTFVADRKFLEAINHEAGTSPMPKNKAKLQDSIITKIETWVSQGTPE